MPHLSLQQAIFTTRSMRHLKSDPVPRVDLEYLVEAATMAPNAGNMQVWSFVVVTDRLQIERIGKAYREAGDYYIRRGVLADPELDDARRRVYQNSLHNVDNFAEAPAVIIPCLTLPCPDDVAVASGFFGSIFPAIQNILLAARERGLGTTLMTLGTDFSPVPESGVTSLRDVLDLPEDVQAYALIPVGYPKGQWGRPLRKPWQECIRWERW